MTATADTRCLLDRASAVERRIRALIAQRRQSDPAPDDPFRGLYLSDEVVDTLLDNPPADRPLAPLPTPAPADDSVRLHRLARTVALTDQDLEILVISLLPDLDPRFERLYGYLNDDVTRRRASIGLCLELAGMSPMDAAARARLAPGAPLVDHSLVLVEDGDRPFLTRGLRVPDRVTAHLLGDDTADPALAGMLLAPRGHHNRQSAELTAAFVAGQRFCYVREPVGCTATAVATDGLLAAGHDVLCCDAAKLTATDDLAHAVTVLTREAILGEAAMVVSPVEAFGPHTGAVVDRLAKLPVPVVLTGVATWDPEWSGVAPLLTDVARLTVAERMHMWNNELGQLADTVDVGDVAAHFAFGPRQVAAAIAAAEAVAQLSRSPLGTAELRHGARAQNAAGLERLARRIEPAVSWADLVLPARGARAAAGPRRPGAAPRAGAVDWRMRPGGGRGARRHRAVRRRLRDRQDDVGRGDRRRPRARPLHRQPRHRGRQVRRRDREEPRTHLHRGRRGQRGAAVRRGRRDLRQAQRGARRPRPVRQHRERLPAAAHGDLRRAGDPGHQPAGQHRRRVHPAARR